VIAIDRRHIRVRLTLWFMALLAAALVLYSAAACFFLLRDLRAQLVRHAIQDVETVEGLLVFTPEGRLILRDDYHNHPESKRVLERLVEVRSPDGGVLFRNEMLGSRSLGESLLPHEGEDGYSEREFVLDDGLRVERVSRRHSVDGHPTIIRVAYPEGPLWQQFRSHLLALILPAGNPVVRRFGGIFPGVAGIAADSADGTQGGRDQERSLAREAAGQPVGRGTGGPGASLQLPAAAPGAILRAVAALHVRCVARAENASGGDAERGGSRPATAPRS
jgi:hypothetical protein